LQRLKLEYDEPLLSFGFNLNVRRYNKVLDRDMTGRGFHSSTSQLNLSVPVTELHETTQCIPQDVLTLSREVDECQPLMSGASGVAVYFPDSRSNYKATSFKADAGGGATSSTMPDTSFIMPAISSRLFDKSPTRLRTFVP
jgi:hypothetical protein